MPLQNIELPAKLKLRIEKRIATMLKQGILVSDQPPEVICDIAFCMPIQIAPKLTSRRFLFGAPEGMRVFVSSGKHIIAAIDFRYAGARLNFSHISQGPPLNQLLKAMKFLVKHYAAKRTVYHTELISFLYTSNIYILVRSAKTRTLYRSKSGKTQELTAKKLEQELDSIIELQPGPDEL